MIFWNVFALEEGFEWYFYAKRYSVEHSTLFL